MTVAELAELYSYNRWGNARVLNAAAALPAARLHQPLGGSFVSAFETLRHILWAEWVWPGRWRADGPAGGDPRAITVLAELRARWVEHERVQRAFLAGLAKRDLERVVTYENPPGTSWSYTVQHMLQHVANHSTYHRGQIATLLRQLGHRLEPTDFLVYFDEGAP